VIWEYVQDDDDDTVLEIDRPGDEDDEEFEDEDEDIEGDEAEPTATMAGLPTAAMTVAYGHLLVASHTELIERVLRGFDERDELARDVDYQLVAGRFAELGADLMCAADFSRTDELFQATYELFRRGELPQAQTLLAKILNIVLGDDQVGTVREPQLDGSKLPDFEVVRRYLGPGGSFVKSEPAGWFVVGFTLGSNLPLAGDTATGETTSR
jgi:hypothetical protein